MSPLIQALTKQGEAAKGSEVGGVLQWAILHIASQDEALAEIRAEHAQEEAERLRLEAALHDAAQALDGTLQVLRSAWCPPVELARDFVPHINLMAGHGDPDYLKTNGNSMRHTDTRSTRARKAAVSKQRATP